MKTSWQKHNIIAIVCVLQEWYVALVKSQCCLRGEGALYETTELLTKLPQSDLNTIMTCKVKTKVNLLHLYSAFLGTQSALHGRGVSPHISHFITRTDTEVVLLYLQDFNLCLLASCLSVGVQRVCKDHGTVLFDTVQQVAFERLAGVVELLPSPHQPLLPSSKMCTDYWQKLKQVYSESQSELSLFTPNNMPARAQNIY